MMQKIRALFTFEILGRPAEHIKKSLEQYIDHLKDYNGVKIENKIVHEPKKVEDNQKEFQEELFTTFGEAELVVDNINVLFSIIFHLLPSHVEIIEPAEIRLNNFDASSISSELVMKLHKYDEIAKSLALERDRLINYINENKIKPKKQAKSGKKSAIKKNKKKK